MKRLLSVLLWSILAAAFIGPGTVTTAASAGSRFGPVLLWALTFSTLACVVLQEASARLTLASGSNLGQALRRRFAGGWRGAAILLLVLGAIVVGCAAYQAGNILGGVAGAALAVAVPRSVLTLATGLAAGGLWMFRTQRQPAITVGVLVLAGLFAGTVSRNEVWSSNQSLWENAAARYPRTARAHKALADVYLEKTRPDLALGHYKEAVKILPGYLDARTGIAVAYIGRREYASALETLDETLERWPTDPKTLNAKAYVLETLGDLMGAMQVYHRAIESDPSISLLVRSRQFSPRPWRSDERPPGEPAGRGSP